MAGWPEMSSVVATPPESRLAPFNLGRVALNVVLSLRRIIGSPAADIPPQGRGGGWGKGGAGGGEGGRSRVQIEDRLPRPLLAELEARGHSFAKVGRKGEVKYGYAALAVVNTTKGTVQGGADPRRSHASAAPGK